MGTITLKDMLDEMETGNFFSLDFVSFDRQRKTGGEIKSYKKCKLNIPKVNDGLNHSSKDQPRTSIEKRERRNPNHYRHSTRSFYVCINDQVTNTVKKFHIFLVLSFNGKKLIL